MRQNDKNTTLNWTWGLALFGLIIAIILPRGLDLTRYTTIDEGLWLYRSANFYYALGQREFEYTHQSEHPGVTTMWAGTLGFLTEYPEYRGLGHEHYMVNGIEFIKFLQKTEKTAIDLLSAGRKFVVLGTTALLLLSFWIVRRTIGNLPAILGFFLLALDPFHIGLTKVLHLDGLLTGFMFLSSTSLIFYLWKDKKPIFLIISAAAGAFSLLTKTPGIFMIPFTGLLLLVRFLEEKPFRLKKLTTHIAIPLILWILIAILVIVLLWPAMWVNPIDTIENISGKMTGYVEGNKIYHYDEETQSLKALGMGWYPLTLLWRNTPVVFIGFLLAVIAFILNWDALGERTTRQFAVSLFFFAFFFLITMGLGDKKTDRYILPIYPAIILISALGWVAASEIFRAWLQKKGSPAPARFAQAAILICLVCLQLVETIRVRPYYNTYYNPLIGGPEQASQVLRFGWGEGLDQVAAYLETQPNPEELTVMSVNAYGPLSFFFSGTAIQTPRRELTPEFLDNFDYVVIYIIQWQVQFQKPLLDAVENLEPEHTITLNGLEYAWIYNVMDISEMEWARLLPAQE
jgi:hypothetical protein